MNYTVTNLKGARFDAITDYLGFETEELTNVGAIIAGGALRTLLDEEDKVKDIDLFFTSQQGIDSTKILLENKDFVQVFACPLGYLFTYVLFDEDTKKTDGTVQKNVLAKVQLITRELYQNTDHVVATFDLMPCCVAWDGKQLVFAEKWIRSVRKKMLYLNNLTYPVATLNRVNKYKQKGYYASEGFYVDIIKEIQGKVFVDEQLALYID